MRTPSAPTRLAAFAAASLLLLAACGGGSDSGTPATAPADALVVKAKDGIAWDAKTYSATAVDGKVTIFGENDSPLAHNLYVLDGSDKVIGSHIDLPKKGSNGTLVFDLAPGTYKIVCKIPGHSNMNSSLTVS